MNRGQQLLERAQELARPLAKLGIWVSFTHYGSDQHGEVIRVTGKNAIVRFHVRAYSVRWLHRTGNAYRREVRVRGGGEFTSYKKAPTLSGPSSKTAVTQTLTAFNSFRELLLAPNYTPSLIGNDFVTTVLANTYNRSQRVKGDERRAGRAQNRTLSVVVLARSMSTLKNVSLEPVSQNTTMS